jgi:tetratricopeptide (TPR) repeat protein
MDCHSKAVASSDDMGNDSGTIQIMNPLIFAALRDVVAFEHILERFLNEPDAPFTRWIESVEILADYADSDSSWIGILLSHLASLAARFPGNSVRLHNMQGRLYRIMGDSSNAIEYFYMAAQKAGNDTQQSVNALLGIIGCHIDMGHRVKACELLEFLEVTQPTVQSNPYFPFFQALLEKDPISRSLKLETASALCQSHALFNVALMLGICEEFMSLNRFHDSIQLLSKLRKKLPCQSADILFGICLVHDSDQEGVDLLSKFSSTCAIAAIALSRFYISQNSPTESDSVLSLCSDPSLHSTPHYALWKLRQLPADAKPHVAISLLLRAAGKPRKMLDMHEWIQVAHELVSVYIESGMAEKGLEVLNTLHFPSDITATLSARLLFSLQRYEEALVVAEDRDEMIQLRKEIYFFLNRISDYMKLLPTDPECIGDAFLRFGAVDDSIRWFSECCQTVGIRKKTAQAYLLGHEFENALEQVDEILSELVEVQKDEEDLAEFCFTTFVELEKFEACWEWYLKISKFSPSVKCAEIVVAMCESVGWIDRGIQIAFQFIDRNSALVGRLALATLTEKLGFLYFQKQWYDEAIFWLSRCFQDTADVAVVSALVRAMEARGDAERAQEILRLCQRRFPELAKNFTWSVSRTPSEDSIKQLLSLPKSNPWRLGSLIVENRRLGKTEFEFPDEEAKIVWDQIRSFTLPQGDKLTVFVFGLVWMIEGRIERSLLWLDENCIDWKRVDPESTEMLVKFFSNQSSTDQKLVYRNCIDFLVCELIEVASYMSLAHAVVVKDKGCATAWKMVGETFSKKDDERFKAWEQYLRLGGYDEEIVKSVGNWYYSTRQYVRVLQLCECHKISDALKTEYEKSKIKLFRAY